MGSFSRFLDGSPMTDRLPIFDGHNDVLYVKGICLQSLTFMIFDRWGEKVFEKK